MGGPAWNSGAWTSVLKPFWAVLILENHVPGAFPAGVWFGIIFPGGQLGVSPVGVGALPFGGRIFQKKFEFFEKLGARFSTFKNPPVPPKVRKNARTRRENDKEQEKTQNGRKRG